MTDETKEEEKGQEPVSEKKDVKESAMEIIENTNKAAERMEAANTKHAELIEAEAKLKLEKTFDGKADAGEGKATDTDEDYAKKVMANDLGKK